MKKIISLAAATVVVVLRNSLFRVFFCSSFRLTKTSCPSSFRLTETLCSSFRLTKTSCLSSVITLSLFHFIVASLMEKSLRLINGIQECGLFEDIYICSVGFMSRLKDIINAFDAHLIIEMDHKLSPRLPDCHNECQLCIHQNMPHGVPTLCP